MPAKVVERLESYKIDQIANLKRRQLQTLCKANGIKANSKNVILVKELQNKLKAIEKESNILNKENSSINSNNSSNKSKKVIKRRRSFSSKSKTPIKTDEKIKEKSTELTMNSIIESTNEYVSENENVLNNDDQAQTQQNEYKNVMMTDDIVNYNANPNGNNGSFVDIESDLEMDENENNNMNEGATDETSYTNHNITDISLNNVNNGSMIGNQQTHTIIVNHNITDASSLSIEPIPKLNESMEEFIRKSLNPQHEEEESENEEINNNHNNNENNNDESDNEDVDMEITPFCIPNINNNNNDDEIMSLADEINQSRNVNNNASRISINQDYNNNNNMNNMSMLGMNASRISVKTNETEQTEQSYESYDSSNSEEEEEQEEEQQQEEEEEEEASWKQTPLKALQILNSIRDSISLENINNNINNNTNNKANDNTNNSKEENDEASHTHSFVENLFYNSPARPALPAANTIINEQESGHIVQPKSEIIQDKNSRKISMTFGDGQTYAFKSVYSPTKSKSVNRNKSISMSANRNRMRRKSTSVIDESLNESLNESLCEKTASIRQMFEDGEREYDHEFEREKINKSNSKATAKPKAKAKTAPDWNKIHQEQIFSRQPDLAQWDKQKQERSEKLFGISSNKMSTPTFRRRSQSMIGKKLISSDTKIRKNEKRKVRIVPSGNDHLYNHSSDNKLNRKIHRQPTPYKPNTYESAANNSNNTNKKILLPNAKKSSKASKKPRFSTSISENTNSNSNSIEIAKKDLAYDPDKVKSKLFTNTNSSMKKIRKGAQTPQIMKSNYRNSRNNSKSRNKNKNWSAVKSKVNSNNNTKTSGVKRKLSWNMNGNNNANDDNMNQPVQKKRKISTQINNTNSQK